MLFQWTLGGILGILSGVAMGALALAALAAKPRTRGATTFAVFGLLWALAVVAGNLQSQAADAETLRGAALAVVVLYAPLHLALLAFAASVGEPAHPRAWWWALALPAAALLALVAWRPELFASVGTGPRGPRLDITPLYALVVFGNSVVAFAAALAITWRKRSHADTSQQQTQLALVNAALCGYVAYRGLAFLTPLADPATALARYGAPLLVVQSALALGCAALVALVVLDERRRGPAPWSGLLAAAALAGGVLGVIEGTLPGIGLSTASIWRLAMVGLFTYAMVRYRLFDIELRIAGLAPGAAYVLAVASSGAFLWTLAGATLTSAPVLAGAAIVGVAMACAPAARVGRLAVARLAPHVQDPDYLYKRKVDVYRSALEEASVRGMGQDTEVLFLSDLRRRLGITEQEHRVMMLVVQGQAKYSTRITGVPATFEIVRELGRGANGRVLLARDPALDRLVVLKQPLAPWLLDEQGRRHFLREARTAASLRHPNVVTIHQVLPEAEPPAIVMEYVSGGSLASALATRGPLAQEEAVAILRDVLAGLDAIHAAGIVHRDVKPGNVLLDESGRAKVADFGISHAPPRDDLVATLASTTRGQPGSVAYMSPEQARGEKVDARTDLYAAAAVLHAALSGRHYLDLGGLNELQARQRIQDAPPEIDSAIAPTLRAFLERALAKRPEARFESAARMREALVLASGQADAARAA